jgi:hypothetical protein
MNLSLLRDQVHAHVAERFNFASIGVVRGFIRLYDHAAVLVLTYPARAERRAAASRPVWHTTRPAMQPWDQHAPLSGLAGKTPSQSSL